MKTRTILLAVLIAASAPALFAQTIFVRDTFTAGANTLLEAHAPDTGGAWSRIIGAGGLTINAAADNLRNVNNNDWSLYSNATVAPNAEIVVGLTVTFTNANANNFVNVFGRGSVALVNGYLVQVGANGAVTLTRYLGATPTVLASATIPMTLNVAHQITFSITNALKEVRIDNNVVVSSTDDAVTAAGLVGLGENSNTAAQVIADNFFASTFSPTEARVLSFGATIDERGRVLIEWKTAQEKNNLGYRVWREGERRGRQAIGGMIAGAAFITREARLQGGNSYRQIDQVAPRQRGAAYWIEELDLNGNSSWYGPLVPMSGTIARDLAPSPSLQQLAQLSAGASKASLPEASVSPRMAAQSEPRPVRNRPVRSTWDLPSRNAIKISVDHDGWYRITAPELFEAGLPRNIDPRALQLWVDGVRVPMTVEGEADEVLNDGDAIRFYGTALDTPLTDRHVYWLGTDSGAPSRIRFVTGRPTNPTTSSFIATAEREDKVVFLPTIDNGDEESFFGPLVSMDPTMPTQQSLRLQHIDRAVPTATLRVVLQGVSQFGNTAHRVLVSLNGQRVGELLSDGVERATLSTSVPSSLLIEGTNLVSLAALNGDEDISVVKSVRIDYAHSYTAEGDQLLFTSTNGVKLDGFSTTDVHLLDVTSPNEPLELPVTATDGQIRATLTGGERRIVAITGSGYAHPVAIEANVPSALHNSSADLVILTDRSLSGAAAHIAQLHRAEGYSVIVAEVTDVYDEFSYGNQDTAAIRSYLAKLHANGGRQVSALLLGDASFDPRNHLGLGDFDLVPTRLVVTRELKTASDNWFVDFDDDTLPDMAIGRIPARTAADAEIVAGKIASYLSIDNVTPWSRRTLFVVDSDPEESFRTDIEEARALVPPNVDRVMVDVDPDPEMARQRLLAEWHDGAALIDYFGHGSVEVWSGNTLLTSDDVMQLKNGDRLPFVAAMTCLNAYFHDLYTHSLAEAMLFAPKGGAIAVFSSSSLTEPLPQKSANNVLVVELFAGKTFGEASMQALRAAPEVDVRRSFQLIGDPLLVLRPWIQPHF